MESLAAQQATDVPVTLKFMSDMDDHLQGKAANLNENIFTVLSKIPRQKQSKGIEELVYKKIEDFPIKVLMAPDLLSFFNRFDTPNNKEFISY